VNERKNGGGKEKEVLGSIFKMSSEVGRQLDQDPERFRSFYRKTQN
jgi:hypothetical protein